MTFQARHQVFAFNTLRNSLTRDICIYTQATRLFIVTSHHDLRTGHPGTSMIAADFLKAIHRAKRGKGGERGRGKTKSEVQPLKYGTFFLKYPRPYFFLKVSCLPEIFLSSSFFPPSSFFFQENTGSNKETMKRFVRVELVT